MTVYRFVSMVARRKAVHDSRHPDQRTSRPWGNGRGLPRLGPLPLRQCYRTWSGPQLERLAMLATQQPVLRRFWYPVMPLEQLDDGPKPFRLMNEELVLWLDSEGKPHAAEDRCAHRTARLSLGWVEGDNIVCPYHGWTYDGGGGCVRIPQTPDRPAGRAKVRAFNAEARYGYVWVCLGDP